jgi:mono/diheme cytochrome c family protein
LAIDSIVWESAMIRDSVVVAAAMLAVPAAVAAQPVSFEQDVLPIFELRCIECHQPGGQGFEASGLDLTSYETLMEGTQHGPVVVPREYFASTLGAAIDWRVEEDIRMPFHRKKLSKCERQAIRDWVQQGARDN